MTKLWCFIWFMAPVSLCQVNPSVKRLLDTWLGFRCKLVPQICVVHPNEQSSHGCDSLIGVLFWCILHFVLHGMVIVYSSATNRSTYCIALLVCPALAIGSKCTKLFHAALNRRKYLLSLSLAVFYVLCYAGPGFQFPAQWVHPANEVTPCTDLVALPSDHRQQPVQSREVGHGAIGI